MITCPRCTRPLPEWLLRESRIASMCPQCQAMLDVHCFPAIYRTAEKLDLTQIALGEGDACCYEHATKKASALCAHCGRFLCALCEVPLGDQSFCPDCMQSQKDKTQAGTLETHRTLYDSIALMLATWPMLLAYFTIFTAPLSLGIAIYGWRRPTSIVRRSRWRLYAAVGISSLQLAAISVLIISLIFYSSQAKR